MKKVDIFIPYWGDFALLKDAVESVIGQSSDQWMLTIIDDCYPSEEARHYFENLSDARITYIRNNKNVGYANNFNNCIEKAKEEYCTILGCDDKLLPNYVESVLTNSLGADFYQPQVEVIDDKGSVYLPLADKVKRLLRPKKAGRYSGERLASSLCKGNWMYFPSIAWKTSTIKKYRFDTTNPMVCDVILELSIIKDGGVLLLDNTVAFQYRRWPESLSSKAKETSRFHDERKVYERFVKEFSRIGWRRAALSAKLRITSRIHSVIS